MIFIMTIDWDAKVLHSLTPVIENLKEIEINLEDGSYTKIDVESNKEN